MAKPRKPRPDLTETLEIPAIQPAADAQVGGRSWRTDGDEEVLLVPAQPLGADSVGALADLFQVSAAGFCQRYREAPIINVSHDDAGRILRQTQQKLARRIEIVNGRQGLEARLAQLTSCTALPRAEMTIDLIAHSSSRDLVMVFDSWELRASKSTAKVDPLAQFCKNIAPHIKGFRALRLIGCGTASTPAGEEAISVMQKHVAPLVQGTTTNVYIDHFSEAGYIGGYLKSAAGAHQAGSPPSIRLPNRRQVGADRLLWGAGAEMAHSSVTFSTALELAAAVDLSKAWDLPGLLVAPLLAARLVCGTRRTGGPAILECEVLFDWVLLRVWDGSAADGTIYRIRDPRRLARLLRDHNQPVLRG